MREQLTRLGPELAAALDHARRIERLEAALASWLDAPLKRHCRVANVTEDYILLHADSPVWSQRVRFLLPDIGRRLAAEPGSGIPAARRIRIRVAPPVEPPPGPALPPARLSPTAARTVSAAAASLPRSRLRQALEHLAQGTSAETHSDRVG